MKKKRLWAGILAVLLIMSLGGCAGSNTAMTEKNFYMMDTVISIRLYASQAVAEPVFEECQRILTRVEEALSRTVEGSLTDTFNREGQVTFSSGEWHDFFARIAELSQATGGAFDPTVEPLTVLWKTCGQENRLPGEDELDAAKSTVGMEKVAIGTDVMTALVSGVRLDLGAVGKGYAIEQVLSYLYTTEIMGGVLSFGGNVAVFGGKPNGELFRVALRDPADTVRTVGELTLPKDIVVSVSGDYERYVEIDGQRYHHLLDPETGFPVENGLHSVAVVCDDAVLADVLSTALFVMGQQEALAFYASAPWHFEAIFVTDGMVTITPGLANVFTLTNTGYSLVIS